MEQPRKRMHPHKFNLYVAMGSIVMMFAGLTSAYIVREAQGHWVYYQLPAIFYWSTAVIILSSVTMHMGLKAFKSRQIPRYRALITSTLILGAVFLSLQVLGFYQLYGYNIRVDGNPSESFLFIIAGLHGLHILGGVFALLIVFINAYRKNIKVYNATGLEIMATYWHFVDVLWIYLFVFFLANQ